MEVRRKRGETFESFLRRFNKRLLQSGKLFQARKIRFYKPGKSKRELRESALRRVSMSEEREYLKKIGKLPDEQKERSHRTPRP